MNSTKVNGGQLLITGGGFRETKTGFVNLDQQLQKLFYYLNGKWSC